MIDARTVGVDSPEECASRSLLLHWFSIDKAAKRLANELGE